jgi:hypothetical protein
MGFTLIHYNKMDKLLEMRVRFRNDIRKIIRWQSGLARAKRRKENHLHERYYGPCFPSFIFRCRHQSHISASSGDC